MIRGAPLTAVIPVRGGSKGIPGKNLYRLGGGDTLLERTIKLAQSNARIDRVLVTTDDPQMHDIAAQYGAATKVLRPARLASDNAKTIDVLIDMFDTAEVSGGHLVLLQATSPLRTRQDLDAVLDLYESDLAPDAVVSLVAHDAPHPDKLQKIEQGYVVSYTGTDSHIARQLLPKVYAPNGAFYLTEWNTVLSQRTLLPKRTVAYEMPPERSINLDGPYDLILLEALIAKGLVTIDKA